MSYHNRHELSSAKKWDTFLHFDLSPLAFFPPPSLGMPAIESQYHLLSLNHSLLKLLFQLSAVEIMPFGIDPRQHPCLFQLSSSNALLSPALLTPLSLFLPSFLFRFWPWSAISLLMPSISGVRQISYAQLIHHAPALVASSRN